MLEAEDRLAAHQTSHSSGVIHAGVYYEPGSLKARLCTEGRAALIAFCDEKGVPWHRSGKLIVATRPKRARTARPARAACPGQRGAGNRPDRRKRDSVARAPRPRALGTPLARDRRGRLRRDRRSPGLGRRGGRRLQFTFPHRGRGRSWTARAGGPACDSRPDADRSRQARSSSAAASRPTGWPGCAGSIPAPGSCRSAADT